MKALITNAALTLLDDDLSNEVAKDVIDEGYGLVPEGYLFIEDGVISAVGAMSSMPEHLLSAAGITQIDAAGKLLTPVLSIVTRMLFMAAIARWNLSCV